MSDAEMEVCDLRRYASPVIVQNAGQVNIAADGGQQINVQSKSKMKSPARSMKSVKQIAQ
jgi:hypothetical protein